MASKLDVWKQALVHLGKDANALTSLTQEHEARYQFDAAWSGVVAEAFNEGDWNFAKKTVALVVNGGATVALGYSFAFDYPADYERSIAISNVPDFNQEFRDYVDQDGFLHSNSSAIYLRYIGDGKQSDINIPMWPTMFWRYVAVKLAAETCEKLTGSATLKESLDKAASVALRKAKSVDARNEPNKVIRAGSWIRSRRGGYGPNSGLGNTIVGGEIVFDEGDV